MLKMASDVVTPRGRGFDYAGEVELKRVEPASKSRMLGADVESRDVPNVDMPQKNGIIRMRVQKDEGQTGHEHVVATRGNEGTRRRDGDPG